MKMDNTANLIGKAKTLLDQFILSELKKEGLHGIVPSHGDIIFSLFKSESLTMSELATKIGKDPSTVTTLVKKLNSLGYTTLSKDTIDKRVSKVTLTPKGKLIEQKLLNISERMYTKQYDGIAQEEITVFRNVLSRIIDNLSI